MRPQLSTFWHPSAKKELRLLHLSMQPDASFLPIHWREDDLENAFRHASKDINLYIEKVRIPNGETPYRNLDEYDATVVGGASFNIADDIEDFQIIQSIIRRTIDAKVPLIGICLGHQLIAQELGGTIEKGKLGPEMEVVTMQQTAAGKTSILLSSIPDTFSSVSNHRDVVSELPKDSTELAYSKYGNQVVEFAPKTWGVQFHPERSKKTMGTIYDRKLSGDNRNKALMDLLAMDEKPSQQIITNFLSTATTQQSSHHS